MSTTAVMVDEHPGRWRMLTLLAAAELLGMSLWFAASAVGPQLAQRWSLNSSQTGWLTTIVQLGFVCGTAVASLLNLADVLPSRRYFAIAALMGAIVNACLVLSGSYSVALALRFLTGFSLAGVYPPAMKMASTWFKARRGLAIGTVVGALTVGKATPYLVHAMPNAGASQVILTASCCALLSSLLIASFYADGPYPFPPRPFSWNLVQTVFDAREWRLATGGYLGHMFELYSFWTWIPLFLAASVAAHGDTAHEHTGSLVSLIAFGTIAIGGIGSVWGGLDADRRGRERLVIIAMAISGLCSLVIPFAFGHSLWIVGPLAWTWGFFVVADSAQFSALVTEAVPPHAVGTALTVQTSLGFLLTMVSIQLIPPLVNVVGWKWAFPVLALGPAAGIASIQLLLRFKRRPAR
ncbi:MAG TPA: MFS transporter [Gemmatimonadaceae bacterium]